jgi:hypothetical protein
MSREPTPTDLRQPPIHTSRGPVMVTVFSQASSFHPTVRQRVPFHR